MVRECHYVKFTFFSGRIKGENELMGHPIVEMAANRFPLTLHIIPI